MFEEVMKRLKQGESYVSMGLGIVVVLVVGLLIYRNFSQINRPKEQTKTETKQDESFGKTDGTNVNAILPAQYTIVAGDDLWAIADKFYKDPYKWIEIAKENKLEQPDLIHPGNVLTIPKVESVTVAGLPKTGISEELDEETPLTSNAITGDSYTVQKGEYLWDIAVRAYGDGFMINKIIEANNIAQPSLIFSGDVLKIPR